VTVDSAARGLVLVVEDERAIADLLALYLSKAGFGVHVATTGPDALAAVRRHRPVAVVLDLGLPGLDGIDVCRTMRAAGDWTPIVVVTRATTRSTASSGWSSGPTTT
jgi:DNA-binding response OmpR family regulator